MCRNIINSHLLTRRDFLQAAAAVAAYGAGPSALAAPERSVERNFASVPNQFRMRMHWYIFGPAWTTAEADRELRLMAAQNIGGVLIFPAYPIALDDPAHGIRNEDYLSAEYLTVFRSVIESSHRLGLTVDTVLGTGWPYGGPSVSLEDSAHCIRVKTLPAGSVWDAVLLPPGERAVAAFTQERGEERMLQEGEAGKSEVKLFYSAPTRMQVKRAALGAEGLILDHYDAGSLRRFLAAVGDKLLDSLPSGAIRSIFSDSLEVYRATWTARLPEYFERRCRYDLRPNLTVLFDANHPDAHDVRRDYWGLLSNLAGEMYVRPLGEWARSKGVTTQVEAYGTPPVNISSYKYVDVPVGEHYEWKEFSSSRWASSGAHLAGKPVALAEAWTWLGLPNRFADTLEQLKLCSDLHFLSGINALYGLSYGYSPAELGSPGWVPYFGPAINHTSPYWPHFHGLADYVNRASFVLQQGKPVADVAVYLPAEDAMADAPPDQLLLNWAVRDRLSSNGPPPEFSLKNALHFESDVVKTIITNGYSFDGIDTHTLNGGMQTAGGRLRMGDGDYAVLVLPNLIGMDFESAEAIESFVQGGGIAIATKRVPDRCWGMRDREARGAHVREIVARMFGQSSARDAYRERRHGKGLAIFCADEQGSFRKALAAHPPDVNFFAASPHVSFVHRRSEDRDFYFLVNTSEESQNLDAVFRVGSRTPEIWDLKTGTTARLAAFEPTEVGPRLRFALGPLESSVFVFREGTRKPVAERSNLALPENGAKVFDNGNYYLETGEVRRDIRVDGIPAPFILSPQWQLNLNGLTLTLDRLKSWTEIPEARFFSGLGIYEAEFEAPPLGGLGVLLDLGQVRETAEVSLNGRVAGLAWMRPYNVDVTTHLKLGPNRLRIDVTNLLINKILGIGPIDYSKVFEKYGERFWPEMNGNSSATRCPPACSAR